MKRFCLALSLLLPVALSADRILLKNGETVAGRFLGEERDGIVVETPDGNTRRVPTTDIEEVKLGLMGMRLCYEAHSKRTCDDQFRAIRKGALIVASAPDFESETAVPMSGVTRLEIWPQGRGNLVQDIDYLSGRANLTLTTGQELSGRIERTRDGLSIASAGGKVLVDARLVDHLSVDFTPERNIRVRHFFPGLKRYEEGQRWIGGAQAMIFTAALGLSAYSAYGLGASAARGKSDPSTWLFYNTSHRSAFTSHMQTLRTSAWLAGGMFCLNFLDVFFGPRIGSEGRLTAVDVHVTPGLNMERRASVALRLAF
jgi:hypothetical protein